MLETESLIGSVKNELLEQLLISIEEKFVAKKSSMIPHSEKLYKIFSTDKEVIKKEITARKAYLNEKYPHDDGSGSPLVFVIFSKPKPLPNDNGDHSPSPARKP